MKSRFKIGKAYGDQWHRSNGVAQGCPLSIMWANLLGAVWAKAIRKEAPRTQVNIFVDDKSLRTQNRSDFVEAFEVNAKFDRLAVLELNMSKVNCFASRKEDQAWLAKFEHKGKKVNEVKDIVTLGHQLSVRKTTKNEKGNDRIEKGKIGRAHV